MTAKTAQVVFVLSDGTTVSAATTVDVTGSLPQSLMVGMTCPVNQWTQRKAEVGPGMKSRRVYDGGWDVLSKVGLAVSERLYPVASVKPGDWGDVLAGRVDRQIDTLAEGLAAYDVDMALTAHHEPGAGEAGTLAEWAKMLVYIKRRVRAIAPKVKVGPNDNGYKFDDPSKQGYTDAQFDAYYTDEVLAEYDFLAADCYHGGTMAKPLRDASYKIRGLTRFADRRGWTGPLGLGEYNGITAAGMRAAHDAIEEDPRFMWVCCFNSNVNNRDGVEWVLTGDRLAEFKRFIAAHA
jgi:hypothetical protein